jgi:hypothetical protein
MLDSFAKHLEVLLCGKRVPVSKVSIRDRKKLQSLLEAGVIEEKRYGAGRSLELCDHDALQVYALKEYPLGLDDQAAWNANPRSRAVAQLRDSKKAVITDAEVLQLRAGSHTDVLIREDEVLPLVEWCQAAGVAAIRLDDQYQWKGSGTISVVENLEVFLHFEKLGVETDLIYYAAGRLSERVLGWLSSPGMQACQIVHFGDYDPVGIDEYLRLKRACPNRVKMYVPDDLESLMSRYGKAGLLEDSKSLLMRLRKEKDETVSKIILLMDRYNCGLEQEILLLS